MPISKTAGLLYARAIELDRLYLDADRKQVDANNCTDQFKRTALLRQVRAAWKKYEKLKGEPCPQ